MRMPNLEDERAAENARMRKRSGYKQTHDPLVEFLYILMRDEVPCGIVESKASEAINSQKSSPDGVMFTNGWLAEYAKDLAERLRPKQESPNET